MLPIRTIYGEHRRVHISKIALSFVVALGYSVSTFPAAAADFVIKFGTATINETQHQFIKFYKDEIE